jgi:hypothetical protein
VNLWLCVWLVLCVVYVGLEIAERVRPYVRVGKFERQVLLPLLAQCRKMGLVEVRRDILRKYHWCKRWPVLSFVVNTSMTIARDYTARWKERHSR